MEEKTFEEFIEGFDKVIEEVEGINDIIDKFLAMVDVKEFNFDNLTEKQKIVLKAKELKFARLIKDIKSL